MDDYICVRCNAWDDNIGMSGLCDACEEDGGGMRLTRRGRIVVTITFTVGLLALQGLAGWIETRGVW